MLLKGERHNILKHVRASSFRETMVKWKRYEKRKAKEYGRRRLGGPGKPDFLNGVGEVKNWSSPMSKTALDKEIHKGRTVIIAKSGFTKPAIEHVCRHHPRVKLYHKNKRVKCK